MANLWCAQNKFYLKRNSTEGVDVVGAAIGSDNLVSSCLLESVKELEEYFDSLVY